MVVTKVISTIIKNGLRLIKVLCLDNPRTPAEGAPYGYDGNPLAGMTAIYGGTVTNGQDVIVGYINTAQMAASGEVRLYAQDATGTEKARIWLHANGSIELGGTGAAGSNVNHATQWEALNMQLQASIVTFINTQLPLIAAGIVAGGGTYTPGTMTLDITTAKLNNIKTE